MIKFDKHKVDRFIIFSLKSVTLIIFLFAQLGLFAQSQTTLILNVEKYVEAGSVKSSGEGQFAQIETRLPSPFIVQVTDTLGNPMKGVRVYFEIVKYPYGATGFQLERVSVFTNSEGLARTHLRLGNKEGEYQVVAKIKGSTIPAFTLFTVYARPSNWILMLFVGLLGGLALFFLGISQMSIGLKHGVASQLRVLLLRMSKNKYVATFFGALVTVITQSSSATTVMLVGFVQSKLLKFQQTIGMIIGAAIGTTITVQLISFKLSDYSLLIVAVGFGLMGFSKKQSVKSAGEALLGFGMLFYGMHLMSGSMAPLKTFDPFLHIIEQVQRPLIGVLVATLFTAIIQSSAAFIGIVLTLATQGLITLEGSIPLLMGANLGTAVTGIIASFSSGREAKKVAMAYTVFKFIGILLLFWLIQPFSDLVRIVTPDSIDVAQENQVLNLSRQIANAHTIYNVLLALVVLPFTNQFARIVDWVMPIFPEEKVKFRTNYIDENLLSAPSVAIGLARKELVDMAHLVKEMLDHSLEPFTDKSLKNLEHIRASEAHVNFLRDKINDYLLRITHKDIAKSQIDEVFQVMFATKELEQIGDIVSKGLIDRARWWVGSAFDFSEEGKKELAEYHKLTQKQLRRAIEILESLDIDIARRQMKKYDHFKELGIELERSHFERLKQDIGKSVESSKTHLELVGIFRTIGSHANNIARIVLENS
ncbi:MAG: Na/Pi symporter [Bacteroidales bacterium]